MDHAYYNLEVDEILKKLKTSERGLSQKEAKRRLTEVGPNSLEQTKERSKLEIFFSNFKSPLIYILLFAAGIAFFSQKIADTFVILSAVLVNAVIGFYLEIKAEKSLRALKDLKVEKADILRDGQRMVVKSSEIVPGDILYLSEGDKISADARVIKAHNLFLNESTFTGESVSKEKTACSLEGEKTLLDSDNIVFMGTIVSSGRGLAVVFNTGENTEFGKISDLIGDGREKITPLQKKLNSFSKKLGFLILAITIFVFFLGIATGESIIKMAQVSISLAVSAIPEGLPVAIITILSVGVYRMSKKKAVVGEMEAVETLGRVNIICTDKTGTLTLNELKPTRIYIGQDYHIKDIKNFREKNEEAKERLAELLTVAVLCNDSEEGEGKLKLGDSVEAALLTTAQEFGLDEKTLRQEFPRLAEIPFTSDKKFMATLNAVDDLMVINIKGAPEEIIKRSSFFHKKDGNKIKLTNQERESFLKKAEEFSQIGLKVLAFAYKDSKIKNLHTEDIKDLVLVGLIGLTDPLRKEAKEAVEMAKSAGIKVIMISGDHLNTAIKIAKEAGILRHENEAVLAEEIEKVSGPDLEELLNKTSVFARVTPELKYKIIEYLKGSNKRIISMTGDGVNDVPALMKADVGVAMGVSGMAAAREASDIVLSDDNFATIVVAIDEGRTIFNNIRKVLYYLLSTNLGEVLTVILALLISFPIPVTPLQILWINLVTDGFLTIPIGLMASESNNLKKPPRRKEDGLISRGLALRMILVSGIIAVGTLYVFVTSLGSGLDYARTMAFLTLVIFQWFNALNSRSEQKTVFHNILKDKQLFFAILGALIMQWLVIYLPLFNNLFHTVPLSSSDWLRVIVISSSVIIFVELVKLIDFVEAKLKPKERPKASPIFSE